MAEPYPLVHLAKTPIKAFLDIIRQAESGGNDFAIGDNGLSRGPFQIKEVYWQDGCEYGKVRWDYFTYVWNREKSSQVVRWYWMRYCPSAVYNLDFETLARTHNGGPKGVEKKTTLAHWLRVKAKMPKKLQNLENWKGE